MKTPVFRADIADFAAMNEVYGKHFSEPFPCNANLPFS
ncbi:hypothetical protein [Candidatus Symbiothrix dinenymphae]